MKKYLFVLLSFLTLVACRQADNTQSLQGEWLFALDPDDRGLTEQWYNRYLNETIQPGQAR